MNTESITLFASLFITLVSIITGFALQLDRRRIRELKRENRKIKTRLSKAIMAINGYQTIEEEIAKEKGLDISTYRSSVRRGKSEFFDSNFLSPSNIVRLMGSEIKVE